MDHSNLETQVLFNMVPFSAFNELENEGHKLSVERLFFSCGQCETTLCSQGYVCDVTCRKMSVLFKIHIAPHNQSR